MKGLFNTVALTSFILIFALSSCGDDDNDDPQNEAQCSVTNITMISAEDDGNGNTRADTAFVQINYDTEGRVLSIIENYKEEECTMTTNCQVDDSDYETHFAYNGSQIASIRFFEDNVELPDFSANVTYDGDRISTYRTSEPADVDEYRFVYENERITRIEFWNGTSANSLALYETIEFSYTGNNITRTEYREENGDLTFAISATFDDRMNPNFNNFTLFPANLAFDDLYELPFLFSENNPVSITSDDRIDQEQFIAVVTYEYNEFGVPVSYSLAESGARDFSFDAEIVNVCE